MKDHLFDMSLGFRDSLALKLVLVVVLSLSFAGVLVAQESDSPAIHIAHPWDPNGPAVSAHVPLLIGYARTEETLFDEPTPQKLVLDDAGLRERALKRIARKSALQEATPAVIEATQPNST